MSDQKGSSLSEEVQQAILAYAMGNPGVIKVLVERQSTLQTAKDVENLVGWPLSEHTQERTGEIWDKLRKHT